MNFKDKKILLIDDDKIYLDMVKKILEKQGYILEICSNPEDALIFLENNKVDIVLSDYFMPQMTGEEFINKFREFDKETMVILQTGYSDQKPPLEMLQNLNIQGYFDKTAGVDQLLILIISAIKTIELTRKIKEQEEQLDAQQYKDEFFGSFVNLIIEEISNKTMIVGGALEVMKQDEQYIPNDKKEEYNRFVNNTKQSISELSELSKAVNIGNEKITAGRFNQIIDRLLKMDLIVTSSTLKFSVSNDYLVLDCNPKILVYIVIELIRNLVKQNINLINILVEKEEEKVRLKICHKIEDNDLLNKVNKLAVLDNNINVEIEYEQPVITIG